MTEQKPQTAAGLPEVHIGLSDLINEEAASRLVEGVVLRDFTPEEAVFLYENPHELGNSNAALANNYARASVGALRLADSATLAENELIAGALDFAALDIVAGFEQYLKDNFPQSKRDRVVEMGENILNKIYVKRDAEELATATEAVRKHLGGLVVETIRTKTAA